MHSWRNDLTSLTASSALSCLPTYASTRMAQRESRCNSEEIPNQVILMGGYPLPGDPPKLAAIEIVYGLDDLLAAIHDEGAVTDNGLVERFPG